jgi:HD superfamily phosphodiesterase
MKKEKTTALNLLYIKMIEYFSGDPRRIQHFIKVHSLSRLIGQMENLSEEQLFILEAAAYVHDIGIKEAERIYGTCNGKLQEELGPQQAKPLLIECGFTPQQTERILYLIAHHHTYTNIDGTDYQILVEADFLVNIYEDNTPISSIKSIYQKIFKTESGKHLCRTMFKISDTDE